MVLVELFIEAEIVTGLKVEKYRLLNAYSKDDG
jgi:hypothetical protein